MAPTIFRRVICVNDACVLTGKPNVYGSIFRFEGQASVFATEDGPCYRCLYPEPPPPGLVPSCAEGGVLGILPGPRRRDPGDRNHQADSRPGRFARRHLLLVDALGMKFRELKLRKNPDCPVCGKNPTITKLIDYEEFCGIRGQEEPAGNDVPAISVEELKKKLDAKADIFILDVREPHEYQICNLQGYLIPVGDLPEASERTRLQPRNHSPLQDGRTQRQSRKLPPPLGIQEGL